MLGPKDDVTPRKRRWRPTYAGVAATLALALAMSGGAVASSFIITSTKQIKPSVLKKLKGRRGRTGPAGPAGPTGATGATGATGGPGAPNPNATAVDGQAVTKIFGLVDPAAAAVQVYSGQGLTITLSCPTSTNVQLVANGPAAANATLTWQGNGQGGPFEGRTEPFDSSANTVIGAGLYGSGVATYATAAGSVVTVTYGYDDIFSGVSTTQCQVWGHAVSG